MPKLDLRHSKGVKSSHGTWLQAKGVGWSWKPAVQPPADYIFYSANIGVFANAEGTIPAVIDGPVMRWNSQGIAGWDYVQTDVTRAPTLKVDEQGKAYVHFSQNQHNLRCTNNFSALQHTTKAMRIYLEQGAAGQIWGRNNSPSNNRRFGLFTGGTLLSWETQQATGQERTASGPIVDGSVKSLVVNVPAGSTDSTVDAFSEVDGTRFDFQVNRGGNVGTFNFDLGQGIRNCATFRLYRFAFKPNIAVTALDPVLLKLWLDDH